MSEPLPPTGHEKPPTGHEKPLLGLQMMVKNEAKALRGVLEAARPFIDFWVILDTGSTDGTQEIIREVLHDVPGKLYEEPFTGYMSTRNRLLELEEDHKATVFSIMLNGDEYLRDGEKLREYLETQRGCREDGCRVDCHFLRLTLDTGLEFQPRILRVGSLWHYDDFDLGVHEVPVHPDGEEAPRQATYSGFIEHVASDPIARMDNIWESHIPKLRAALERNPKNGRALEFLIQSLEAFFPHMLEYERMETAIECVQFYARRFELPFVCDAQRNFFMMRFIDTARLSDLFDPEELLRMTDELCKHDSERPEPYFLRAVIASTCPTKLTSDVYQFAREAAQVAEKVRLAGGLKNSSPLDISVEWKAHRLAAIAAANLAEKYPENLPLAKDHIAAGLAAGGPWMVFKGIVDDGRIEGKVQLENA